MPLNKLYALVLHEKKKKQSNYFSPRSLPVLLHLSYNSIELIINFYS